MNSLVGGVAAVMIDIDDHKHDNGAAPAPAAPAAAAAAAPLHVNTALARQPQEDRLVGAIFPARKQVATIRQLVFRPQDVCSYGVQLQ